MYVLLLIQSSSFFLLSFIHKNTPLLTAMLTPLYVSQCFACLHSLLWWLLICRVTCKNPHHEGVSCMCCKMSSYPLWCSKWSRWFKNPQSADILNESGESVKLRKGNAFRVLQLPVLNERTGLVLQISDDTLANVDCIFRRRCYFSTEDRSFRERFATLKCKLFTLPQANQFSDKLFVSSEKEAKFKDFFTLFM